MSTSLRDLDYLLNASRGPMPPIPHPHLHTSYTRLTHKGRLILTFAYLPPHSRLISCVTFTPHTWPVHRTRGHVHSLFKVAKDTLKITKPGFPRKLLIEFRSKFSLCIWSNVRIHHGAPPSPRCQLEVGKLASLKLSILLLQYC